MDDIQRPLVVEQDGAPVRRPAPPVLEERQALGGDPPHAGAVEIDDEERHVRVGGTARIDAAEDQPLLQSVSRVGSGYLNWRKVPVSGSTIVAAQFSSPSVQAVKIETWLPSGDQRGPTENPGNSCCRWLPSGFAV